MQLSEAIARQTKSKLFVSLALKPGVTGQRVYTKIFNKYNIDAEYVACECTDLAADMELVRKHCAGASITMPYKQQVVQYIDVNYSPCTPVNTVVNTNGFLAGYNCDLMGLNDVLAGKLAGKTVKILGSGAMSQNAQIICREYAKYYKVYSRKQENWMLRNTTYDVLINTTSIGMDGIASPVESIRADLVVDCVIGAVPLHRQAMASNIPIITGHDIYLAQLKHQARLYTGITVENPYEFLA
jgi:shikimate 5-dehydrogenase